jgi:hypothetical protein
MCGTLKELTVAILASRKAGAKRVRLALRETAPRGFSKVPGSTYEKITHMLEFDVSEVGCGHGILKSGKLATWLVDIIGVHTATSFTLDNLTYQVTEEQAH